MPGKRERALQEALHRHLVRADERGGRPRPGAPGRARDGQRREPGLVRGAEVHPGVGQQVEPRRGPGDAPGPGQGVLDGDAHVRESELSLEGAVDELDERVDEALWMDEHVDPLVGDIVQPACLDDLQALVHERRGIDGDLGAHGPGRVCQGVARRRPSPGARRSSPGTAHPTRSAAAGPPSPSARRPATATAPSAPSRWAAPRPAGWPSGRRGRVAARAAASVRARGITRWPPATSVSLLAVATTLPARSAARTGRRLTMPPVATMTRSTSSRVAKRSRASGSRSSVTPGGASRRVHRGPVRERRDRRSAGDQLGSEGLASRPGGDGDDPERFRTGAQQHVQRLTTDGAGGAQQRDPDRDRAGRSPGSRH